MLALEQISPNDIISFVRIAFEGDSDLLGKYHITPGELDHCVNDTVRCIHENALYFKEDFVCYRVSLDGIDIGYVSAIIDENHPAELYSFGINIAHRNSEVLKEWVRSIKEKLGKTLFTILWRKNDRAINFFKKNGFVEEEHGDNIDFNLKTLLICRQVV